MKIGPRKGFERKAGIDARQRVPTKALTEGKKDPIYVSTKRTHRFGGGNFMEYPCYQRLMWFAGAVCRWVRFGKRTHRGGVLGVYSLKSGVVRRLAGVVGDGCRKQQRRLVGLGSTSSA